MKWSRHQQAGYPTLQSMFAKRSLIHLQASTLLLLSAHLICLISSRVHASERPNLVFILADDCTYLDMEVYGGQAKTPRLNKFASEGLTFSRCFQAAPMCSPTRHNIYTGLYPVKSGAHPNHTFVHPGTKSIAHYLKEVGYRVALSGKAHISPKESFPFEYSSDFGKNDPVGNDPYPSLKKLITESQETGNPFCIFACSNEPHGPYTKGDPAQYAPESLTLPPTWADTKQTRISYSKYLAEITYFDQQCGALLDLLNSQGLRENTLVLIASEQGSAFPFAKWTCYEVGLASGLLARWPNHIPENSKSAALVEYVDVTPTFLDAARAPSPPSLDGKSFLPTLKAPSQEHKTYTFGIQTTRGIINGSLYYGVRSCGTKTHRYIRNLHHRERFQNIVTQPRDVMWQSWVKKAERGDSSALAATERYQDRPAEELYDVVNDPHCLTNLARDPEHAELKQELSIQLDRWMTSQNDLGHETEANALERQHRSKKQAHPKKS